MKDNISGIYVITNEKNNKQYVGFSKNIKRRWSDHRSKAMNPCKKEDIDKPLYRAMRKYGIDNFSIKVLEEIEKDNLIQMKEREIFYIEKLKSYSLGYNTTRGGDAVDPDKGIHRGENCGLAKIMNQDVIEARQLYQKGIKCKDAYDNYISFQEKITYSGFHNMYIGKTWKHIMPEIFIENKNPSPRKKFAENDVLEIRKRYKNGESISKIWKESYKNICGRTAIHDICCYKTYKYLD